jgi:hypothetical protein
VNDISELTINQYWWIEHQMHVSMIRIQSVQPIANFTVRLVLTDGSAKIVDLEPYLRGPIFEALKKKPAQFRTVKVDPQLGTIVWDNGADIDPDVLIKGMNAKRMVEKTTLKRRIPRVSAVKEKKTRYKAQRDVKKKQ